MIDIYKHTFKNPYYQDNVLWEYSKNDYTLKIVYESPLKLENGFYQANYRWTKNNKETVLTLYENKSDNRKLGLFISEYCYKLVKGKKLFEAQHTEEFCKKFGIYTVGTILDSATDTKNMRSIFVFTDEGWKKYEKPEAVVEYPELQSFYKVEELI